MNSRQAQQYLDSFINYEISPLQGDRNIFKLDRVNRILAALNYPQQKFISLHVAGTKGKGSTCAFISSILNQAGFSVGLYTSPHLESYYERIRVINPNMTTTVNDPFPGQITDDALAEALSMIEPIVEDLKKESQLGRFSFFELFTVAALLIFHKSKVDFVVLETGLGGRLDATNVVDAKVCGITPISLEHTQFLGKTVEAIAAEKIAIVKNKFQTAVIAPQLESVKAVIAEYLKNLKVKAFWVGKEITVIPGSKNLDGQKFSIKTQKELYANLETQMLGEHQMVNAAVAIGMIEYLQQVGYQISKSAIERGVENAYWAGRFEIVNRSPLIIVDGAHTPSSVQVLAQTAKELLKQKKMTLIMGFSDDKDVKGLAGQLNAIADTVIFTKADHPRAVDLNEKQLQDLFPGKAVKRTQSVEEAVKLALRQTKKDEVLLITGSLFVVGEARRQCIN